MRPVQIPDGATAAETNAIIQQHKAQYQLQVQAAHTTAKQAATLQATEHMNKYINLQLNYNKHAGVTLGMIYLSIDLLLKPLVMNLESPANAYKAICAHYETLHAQNGQQHQSTHPLQPDQHTHEVHHSCGHSPIGGYDHHYYNFKPATSLQHDQACSMDVGHC